MPLISIASLTLPSWQGVGNNVSLFVFINSSFTAESGTYCPVTIRENLPYGGRQSTGTFYLAYPCTVSGGALTIPALSLDSTTDSPDNAAGATYSAVFWDASVGNIIQPFGTFESFPLPSTPTSTTWAAIFSTEQASNA